MSNLNSGQPVPRSAESLVCDLYLLCDPRIGSFDPTNQCLAWTPAELLGDETIVGVPPTHAEWARNVLQTHVQFRYVCDHGDQPIYRDHFIRSNVEYVRPVRSHQPNRTFKTFIDV